MSPCKKLESYDTPLCHFSNGGKKRKITKNSGQPSAQRRSNQNNAKYYGHFGAGARTLLRPIYSFTNKTVATHH